MDIPITIVIYIYIYIYLYNRSIVLIIIVMRLYGSCYLNIRRMVLINRRTTMDGVNDGEREEEEEEENDILTRVPTLREVDYRSTSEARTPRY